MCKAVTVQAYNDIYESLLSFEDGFDHGVMDEILEDITSKYCDSGDELTIAMMLQLQSLFINIATVDFDYDYDTQALEASVMELGTRLSSLVLSREGV